LVTAIKNKELIVRAVIFLMTALLIYIQTASAGDVAAGAAKAEACSGCHNAVLSLNGRGADAITDQIKAIRSGDKDHPPGLADLSDEDIADIAAYLDGA
jgi:cytochrome c553